MKRFILMFTAILFLANAFSVSAWAKPCLNMNEPSPVSETMSIDDIPCHETAAKDQSSDSEQCCEGMCLHCHVTHVPLTLNPDHLNLPFASKDERSLHEDTLFSFDVLPPRRPPKINS